MSVDDCDARCIVEVQSSTLKPLHCMKKVDYSILNRLGRVG